MEVDPDVRNAQILEQPDEPLAVDVRCCAKERVRDKRGPCRSSASGVAWGLDRFAFEGAEQV